jgi:YegS/Rv2252/BmrU family lipid kinase
MNSDSVKPSPQDRTPPHHPRVLIVFNPQAGQAATVRPAIDRATTIWNSQGWQVEVQPTRCAGDGTRIAQAAVTSGFDIVVAAGGDGTVNEVMNGLVHSDTALGVLPAGTVNIWAREMGLPMDIGQSAQALLQASWQQIDVGHAQTIMRRGRLRNRRRTTKKPKQIIDRYFLLMAGVGFDAAVTAIVNPTEKKYLGAIAYIKQALQLAWKYKGRHVTIKLDGRKISGRILMTIVGNSQLYGGVIKFTMNAFVNDGLLDVCIVKGRSMFKAPLRLLSIFFRSHHRDQQIEYHRSTQIQFLSRKPVPIQLDGDYIGTTPIQFDVVSQSLWVLVPAQADRSLWQANHETH